MVLCDMHHPSLAPLLKLLLLAAALVIFVLIVKLALTRLGGSKFKLKSPLLGVRAQELYRLLVQALPDHVILAEVAFSQMIKVSGGTDREDFRKSLTARQKVADFVVCDKSFSVVAVIELDDSTHSAAKDAKRDEIIREAGSKTIRWHVSRLPRADDIRRQVLGA